MRLFWKRTAAAAGAFWCKKKIILYVPLRNPAQRVSIAPVHNTCTYFHSINSPEIEGKIFARIILPPGAAAVHIKWSVRDSRADTTIAPARARNVADTHAIHDFPPIMADSRRAGVRTGLPK